MLSGGVDEQRSPFLVYLLCPVFWTLTYRQLQGFIEEPIALAVQVGIGTSCFGHTDPGKAGLL